MRWIAYLWARLFKRHKSYCETVRDDHPIALYLMGKEDFIEDED